MGSNRSTGRLRTKSRKNKAHLEEGNLAKTFELGEDEDEQKWFKEYNLLTAKPVIYAAN